MGKSLEEKMWDAYQIALKVCYAEISQTGTYLNWRENLSELFGEEAEDDLTGWVDGLMHKHYHKMASCQCSPQAMIDFDIAAWEKMVDETIERFQGYCDQLN